MTSKILLAAMAAFTLTGCNLLLDGLSSAAKPSPSSSLEPAINASPSSSTTKQAVLDPTKIADIEGFKALSCDQESALKSDRNPTASKVSFKNASKGNINIYWLDFTGKRVSYKKNLAVSRTHNQPTFVTHPWLITNAKDECLGIYVPEQPENAKLTINDSSQGVSESSTALPITGDISKKRAQEGAACLRVKGNILAATVEAIILSGGPLNGAAEILKNTGC